MAQEYGPKVVTDGLVGQWDAADKNSYPGSGASWTDLSGNGHTGTLANDAAYNATNGGSMYFDGTADCKVTVASTTALKVFSGLTVECWCNRLGAGNAAQEHIITKGLNAGDCGWGLVSERSPTTTFQFWHYKNGCGGSRISALSGVTPTTGQWYHVVGTHDEAAQLMVIYVDAINKAQTSNSEGIAENDYTLEFGDEFNRDYNFNGYISPIRIYNRALSAKEVSQNFNAQRSRFSV